MLGIVVVLRAGEFIVSLQIVRADIERLRLRMVAEIERPGALERGWRRSRKATEEARGVLRSSASTMARRKAAAPYSSSSFEQLRGLSAGRFALREGQIQTASLLSGTACSRRPPGVEWNALRLVLSTAS